MAERSRPAAPSAPASRSSPSSPTDPIAADPPINGYAEALAELDTILAELEDPDLDVDRLGGQVRRASQLIAFCKQRIVGARLEVETITNGDDPVA